MRTWRHRNCRSTSPVPLRRFGLSRERGATSRPRRSGWWRRKRHQGVVGGRHFFSSRSYVHWLWFSSTAAAGSPDRTRRIWVRGGHGSVGTVPTATDCIRLAWRRSGSPSTWSWISRPTVKGCGHRMAARPFAVRRDAGQAAGRGRRCRSAAPRHRDPAGACAPVRIPGPRR